MESLFYLVRRYSPSASSRYFPCVRQRWNRLSEKQEIPHRRYCSCPAASNGTSECSERATTHLRSWWGSSIAQPQEYDVDAGDRITGKFDNVSMSHRKEWVSAFTSSDLSATDQWWYGPDARQQNAGGSGTTTVKPDLSPENVFGLARVPIGLTGPLLIRGQYVNGYALVPFSTTEGALAASAARGALALTRSGGVRCYTQREVIHHSPTLLMHSTEDSQHVAEWLQESQTDLLQRLSEHCEVSIASLEARVSGRHLHLDMVFKNEDDHDSQTRSLMAKDSFHWIIREIRKDLSHIHIVDFYQETFSGGDKHLSLRNTLPGQGITVHAEAFVPESVLRDVLKVSSKDLVLGYEHIAEVALATSVPLVNVNSANSLAAIYLSTGQNMCRVNDAAASYLRVEEASADQIGEFQKELSSHNGLMAEYYGENAAYRCQGDEQEGGVYLSLMQPGLKLRTSEDGCLLPAQQECLKMLHCDGPDGKYRLAEIIASSGIGLDLSTLSALASGTFASAHERLGRNRHNVGLLRGSVNDTLLREASGCLGDLVEWTPSVVDTRTSILSDITKTQVSKVVGHLAFDVKVRTKDDQIKTVAMVMKSKATDVESCNLVNLLAQGCGLELACLYELFKLKTGFKNCHVRELEMLRHTDPRFTSIVPKTYLIKQDTDKEIFVYFMEYMKGMSHFSTADDPKDWTLDDIKLVLGDVAGFHAIYYEKESELQKKDWIDIRQSADMMEKGPLWAALANHNHCEHPEIWTDEVNELTLQIIPSIGDIWREFERSSRTLVHNDFNTRNLCIRPADTMTGSKRMLCLYDWELATLHVPQHDVGELLAFILSADSDVSLWHSLLEHHRLALQVATGSDIDRHHYQHVFDLAMCDLLINRFALYGMAHTFKDYKFCKRIVSASASYIIQRKQESPRLASLLRP